MVYSLIPNAGQSLGETRDGIKENFTTIQTAFQVDHVAYDAAGEGYHSKVNFPQGTAPTVAADSVVMYAKDTNSRPTIFMRQENNGDEIQLSGPTPSIGTNGYTFLPGGLLLQWGVSSSTASNTSITFPVAFTTLYSLNVTTRASNLNASFHKIQSQGNTSFTVINSTATIVLGFYWMAIGTI